MSSQAERSPFQEGSLIRTVDSEVFDQQSSTFACYRIAFAGDKLVNVKTGESLEEIGMVYSRMKFGSVRDIKFFAEKVKETFLTEIDSQGSLYQLVKQAKEKGEHLVYLASGFRNVEHAGYFVFEQAMEQINAALALRGLPTFVAVRPTRLEAVPGSYASMSKRERQTLPPVADHILPGQELFKFGVHVLFVDDVRITGATGDAVKSWVKDHGALSCSDIYLLEADQTQASLAPEMEAKLNHLAISGSLDDSISDILNQDGFRPVQRLLRLVLGPNNRSGLPEFLNSQIRVDSLLKLYLAALKNDYLIDPTCAPSFEVLRELLSGKSVINSSGLPV